MEGAAEPTGVADTFRVLLSRPGQLTEEAIAGIGGQRPRPIFLFLVCSLVYFLSVPIVNRLTASPAAAVSSLGSDPQALDDAVSALEAQSTQSPVIGILFDRLGRDRIKRLLADPAPLDDALANAFTLTMFLLMPFFAALTWIAWRSADTRYSVHVWFASHLHAAWFAALIGAQVVALAGSSVLNVIAGITVLIYSTWYASVAMRRVLGGTNAEFFVRSTLIGIAYVIAVFALVCVLMLFAVMHL